MLKVNKDSVILGVIRKYKAIKFDSSSEGFTKDDVKGCVVAFIYLGLFAACFYCLATHNVNLAAILLHIYCVVIALAAIKNSTSFLIAVLTFALPIIMCIFIISHDGEYEITDKHTYLNGGGEQCLR